MRGMNGRGFESMGLWVVEMDGFMFDDLMI